jgi:CRP/FNR family transcriptional regulator, cyclic AMP receptor protein
MYLQADLIPTLRGIPWFAELNQSQLDRLASVATLHHFEAGDYLFKEGDRKDYLYILIEGQVELQVEVPTRGLIPFYTAETLDVIGWSSMTPIVRQRTANARVMAPSALIGINNKLLEQLCDEDHEMGYIVMRRLANVVANRLLTARLCLLDIIAQNEPQETQIP